MDDWQAITPLVHGAFAMLLTSLFAEGLAKATGGGKKKNHQVQEDQVCMSGGITTNLL